MQPRSFHTTEELHALYRLSDLYSHRPICVDLCSIGLVVAVSIGVPSEGCASNILWIHVTEHLMRSVAL